MKQTLLIGTISLLFTACSSMDSRTWESDTNGPPANMAEVNQDIDESKWPPDNRTGNPAYHLRKEKALRERMQGVQPETGTNTSKTSNP